MIRPGSPLIQAALAGVLAGTLATAAQMLLWWLGATPVVDTLLRDARLTAALLLGPSALAAEPVWRWDVLLAATLIHFTLSFIYAAIALPFARPLAMAHALLAGAAFGLAIYAVNLHGFTLLFPWFAVARGWATLIAHGVFGATLGWACRLFSRGAGGPGTPTG